MGNPAWEQPAKWVRGRPSLPEASRVNGWTQRGVLPTGVVEVNLTPPGRNVASIDDLDRYAFTAAGTDQQRPPGGVLDSPAVVGDERPIADLCFEDECGIGAGTSRSRLPE